jgi:carboxylesterase type B
LLKSRAVPGKHPHNHSARSGDPSTPALNWPAHDLSSRTTMIFDRQSGTVSDPRSGFRDAILQ